MHLVPRFSHISCSRSVVICGVFKAYGLTQLIDKKVNSPYIFVMRIFPGGLRSFPVGWGLRVYKTKTVSNIFLNLDQGMCSPTYCRLRLYQ